MLTFEYTLLMTMASFRAPPPLYFFVLCLKTLKYVVRIVELYASIIVLICVPALFDVLPWQTRWLLHISCELELLLLFPGLLKIDSM
jgi:hypothetical protein